MHLVWNIVTPPFSSTARKSSPMENFRWQIDSKTDSKHAFNRQSDYIRYKELCEIEIRNSRRINRKFLLLLPGNWKIKK
jgi:hypothetical protein